MQVINLHGLWLIDLGLVYELQLHNNQPRKAKVECFHSRDL